MWNCWHFHTNSISRLWKLFLCLWIHLLGKISTLHCYTISNNQWYCKIYLVQKRWIDTIYTFLVHYILQLSWESIENKSIAINGVNSDRIDNIINYSSVISLCFALNVLASFETWRPLMQIVLKSSSAFETHSSTRGKGKGAGKKEKKSGGTQP